MKTNKFPLAFYYELPSIFFGELLLCLDRIPPLFIWISYVTCMGINEQMHFCAHDLVDTMFKCMI